MTPAQKRAELFAIHQNLPKMPSDYELVEMVRPAKKATLTQGNIEFRTGNYFCRELGYLGKQEVVVCYDQHDTSYLIVQDFDGRYLGKAILNGNQAPAFPKTFIEQARQNSDKARKRNLQNKLDKIDFEANQKVIEGIAVELATGFDFDALSAKSLQDDDDGLVLYEDFWADDDEPLKKAI